jgi:DNA polymerase III subunit beta
MDPFQIQAGRLAAAAARVRPITQGIFHSNASIPVLRHLHLQAQDGLLTIRATDLDHLATCTATGAGDLEAITVDAQTLLALVAPLPPEDTVSIARLPTQQLEITSGRFRARLFTLPPEDFPGGPALPSKSTTLTMPAGVLLRLLDRPAFAVSTEETRYYLNGIYLHRHGDRLRAVGTDGHRMACTEEAYPAEAGSLDPCIVPRRSAALLRGLLRWVTPDQAVTWQSSDLLGAISLPRLHLRWKMIGITFPNYEKVMPPEEGAPVVIRQPKALALQIASATAVLDKRSNPIRLANGSGCTLTLSCEAPAIGECTVTVPEEIAAWGSNEAHPAFGIQARYLLDLCRAMPSGFTLRVRGGAEPIHVSGAEGFGALMPMRI